MKHPQLFTGCVGLVCMGLAACDSDPEPEVATTPTSQESTEQERVASQEATAEAESECTERARGAVMSLKRGLLERLTEAMAESPAAAVDVCSREAETIRARVQEESGVQVGRASSRLRNHAANGSPPPWVSAYLGEHEEDEEPQEWSERTEGEVRVISPLIAGGLCLTCHGEDIAPPVLALIDEYYPADEARGYSAGQLRGVVWANAPCD